MSGRSTLRTLLVMAFLSIALGAISQEETADSLEILDQDSLVAAQQAQSSEFLRQADSIRIADSLVQAALIQQIEEAQASDARRRRELQARLDSLQQEQIARSERIRAQVDSLRTNTPGAPVVLYGDTVFYIYSRLGPFTPSTRARNIVTKVEELVDENLWDQELISVAEVEEVHDVLHGDEILLSVTERDAFWDDDTRQQVAQAHADDIVASVEAHLERTSLSRTLMRIGLLIFTLAIFYFGIRYLIKGFNWLDEKAYQFAKPYITGVKFRNYEFLSIEQEERALKVLLEIVKWILIVLIVYLALPILFSIFPATQSIAETLIDYILTPLKLVFGAIVGYIPEFFTIIVIILITRYFVRFLKFLSNEIKTEKLQIPGFYPDWAWPTYNILRIVIYAFAFVVIFPYLPGSDSAVFKGVSVFFGLLISLGSSSAIGNIIAGLVITYMRSFRVGDRVQIGDKTGDVIEKTMLVTKLRTIKNEAVTIPNSAILSGSTVNYSTDLGAGLVLHTTITIGYDVPWREVHELLINAANKTEHVKKEPSPFVFQTALNDFYVHYQINAYTERADIAAKVYSDLHSNIQDAFNEAGVEILSPHYRANRDGNMVTIPAIYLPEDYQQPSFTIKIENEGAVKPGESS